MLLVLDEVRRKLCKVCIRDFLSLELKNLVAAPYKLRQVARRGERLFWHQDVEFANFEMRLGSLLYCVPFDNRHKGGFIVDAGPLFEAPCNEACFVTYQTLSMNLFGSCVEMEARPEPCTRWCRPPADLTVRLSGSGARESRWWEELVTWEVAPESKPPAWIMRGSVDWDGLTENIRTF